MAYAGDVWLIVELTEKGGAVKTRIVKQIGLSQIVCVAETHVQRRVAPYNFEQEA